MAERIINARVGLHRLKHHSDHGIVVLRLESENLLGHEVLDEREAIVLVPDIAQKVRCGNLGFPDWVHLARDALRVAELGHSNTFIGQVNADLIIVWRRIIDLYGVADALK